jgi:hypothetical protein
MKFSISFIGIGLILLAIAILYDVNYINYKAPIPYGDWEKISFSDFRGLKRPGLTLDGVAEFAYIKTDRKVQYLLNGDVAITTYFYPSRSYVFARDLHNPDLLRHELYHFQIAEYCSRLLRKEVFENHNGITEAGIRELNNKYREMEQHMQDEYDEDSYHSYVMQEQKKWELRIDSLLHLQQAFSGPIVHIKNKE